MSVTRCSQPCAGINHSKRSAADERLLESIALSALPASGRGRRGSGVGGGGASRSRGGSSDGGGALTAPRLQIIDARPKLNALANQGKGKGFEFCAGALGASDRGTMMDTVASKLREPHYARAEIVFCDIENIHVMRKALAVMQKAHLRECAARVERVEKEAAKCHGWAPPPTTEGDAAHAAAAMRGAMGRAVVESGWGHHVRMVLRAAVRAAGEVHLRRRPVLVHCSDGWDRTPQICALTELLLDPTYRTLAGFELLVYREWIAFGHKFAQRVKLTSHSSEESPIFVQWLDCVHQLMAQFPTAFEFNDSLLVFLATYAQSAWFADFLFDTEKERRAHAAYGRAPSVWEAVRGSEEAFRNPLYVAPINRVIVPDCTDEAFRLWVGFYLRGEESNSQEEVRSYVADPRFEGALRYTGATMW